MGSICFKESSMNAEIKALHKQAQVALNNKDYKKSHHFLISILQQDKYFADAYFLLAMISSAFGQNAKAIKLIEQALVLSPESAEYMAFLAKHYALENNHIEAVYYAKKSADLNSDNALVLDTIGVAYSQIGLHKEAVTYFKQAVAKDDCQASYFYNLGASLKFIGDFKQARWAYQQTIKLAPLYCKAHAALTSLGEVSTDNNHIAQLNDVYAQVNSADDRLYIGHALAREYETLSDYDSAFSFLSEVKQAKLNELSYNFAQDLEMFEALKSFFSPNKFTTSGYESKEPIFVVGMPRTGTTLVERILSQHSDVTSAGELQHFGLLFKKMVATQSNKVIDADTVNAATNIDFKVLGESYINSTRALTGKTAKFVDKMPLNVLYVGFILLALPKAKIVCLDRNPLDTIVSNFRQLFAVNFSYYNYAYSLNDTTDFYLSFKMLAELWLTLFPENFYLVNYELLVNNPQQEAKKMVEFCGLDWQENCLHIDNNDAPVATASAVQVRQPISNKSIGNWRKYEHYLSDVMAKLKAAKAL